MGTETFPKTVKVEKIHTFPRRSYLAPSLYNLIGLFSIFSVDGLRDGLLTGGYSACDFVLEFLRRCYSCCSAGPASFMPLKE